MQPPSHPHPHPQTRLAVPVLQLRRSEDALVALDPARCPPASLPVPNPTKSFWMDHDANFPLAREGAEGALTREADVCVVGSGITGVSAAYHLSRSGSGPGSGYGSGSGEFGQLGLGSGFATPGQGLGLKVVMLEARDFCSGATGRNGGHLTTAKFQGFSAYAKTYGIEQAMRGFALEDYTSRSIVRIIEDMGVAEKVDLVRGGHTTVFITDEEEKEAREDYTQAEAAGMDLEDVKWLSKTEMEELHGVSYPAIKYDGYNLWPLKFVTELFLLAKAHISGKSGQGSLTLHTNTPVTSVERSSSDSEKWDLNTPRGVVTAKYVIHATNAYASYLLPSMHGPDGIVPTRGQVLALDLKPSSGLGTGIGSWDGNEGFEYWFPRPRDPETTSSTVILGGGRESAGPQYEFYVADDSEMNGTVGETLRAFLPSVYGGVEVEEPVMEWTGIMGYTKTRDPFVGPVLADEENEGQYIAAGYTGHGMPRTFACAEVVASMVIAEIENKPWESPDWLPERYLTTSRRVGSCPS